MHGQSINRKHHVVIHCNGVTHVRMSFAKGHTIKCLWGPASNNVPKKSAGPLCKTSATYILPINPAADKQQASINTSCPPLGDSGVPNCPFSHPLQKATARPSVDSAPGLS